MIYIFFGLMFLITFYMLMLILDHLSKTKHMYIKQMNRRNVREMLWLVTCFGFLMAIASSYIDPPKGWDLYRHYLEIDKMRRFGFSYAFSNGLYKDLYAINFIFAVISLFKNNGLLVFVSLVIELLIFIFFLREMLKKAIIKRKSTVSIIFFTFFAMINVVYAISGIRNVLAMSIAAFAVYIDISGECRKFVSAIFYAIAIFIHPSVIVMLAVRLLFVIKKQGIVIITALLWSLLYNQLYIIFSRIPLALFNVIATSMYLHDIEYSSDWRIIVLNMMVILSVGYMGYRNFKYSNNNVIVKWSKLYLIYAAFTIGSLTNILYFQRATYGIAFLIIPVLAGYIERHSRTILIYIILFADIFLWLFQIVRIYNAIVIGS